MCALVVVSLEKITPEANDKARPLRVGGGQKEKKNPI